MNLPTKLTAAVAFTVLVASAMPAFAFPHKKVDSDSPFARKLTPAQDQLVNKAIAREAIIIKTLRERSPIVETYIQNMRPDPVMGQTVDSDAHYLARVDFGKVIGENGFLSGGAGLRLASGLLFPGLLPRRDALALAGAESLRLLAGTVPLLMIAGILEGFLSPTKAPMLLKFSISAVLLSGLIVWLSAGWRESNEQPA